MIDQNTSPEAIRIKMRQAFTAMSQANTKIAQRLGIHATDFAAIEFLNRSDEPITPTALAQHLALTTGATTSVIDRLERAEYVKRRPNPEDRRGVLISLNDAKRAEVMAAYEALRESFGSVILSFSPQELTTVARFMQTIADVEL